MRCENQRDGVSKLNRRATNRRPQRDLGDPARLVKEFSLNPATREWAFDLSLAVEDALGAAAWDKFNDKQRADASAAGE